MAAPFVDDVGLVADSTPDADLTDVLAVFGAVEMVVPPLEHPLATAGPAKQKDAFFAGNVDHHFVHRKGPRWPKGANRAPPNNTWDYVSRIRPRHSRDERADPPILKQHPFRNRSRSVR